ncbi:hypothetical protein ACIPLC_02665 [Kitasatospora sp. NPDC086801]|uniref:hypothetical protein n=1 Tax=Kitasatospora sp. NPDC086801 TaxID=3364066 RepID=UPI00382BFF0E
MPISARSRTFAPRATTGFLAPAVAPAGGSPVPGRAAGASVQASPPAVSAALGDGFSWG